MRKTSGKLFAALLAVLVLSASLAAGVGAYFSDYETALGEVTLHLSGQTEIKESVADGKKTVSIVNSGESAVVVRAAIYGPDIMEISFQNEDDWDTTQADYYYYTKVLAPGEETSEIYATVNITDPTDEEKAALATLGDQFEVIVVHESAPAVYDENNVVLKPSYYDNNAQKTVEWDYIPEIKAK